MPPPQKSHRRGKQGGKWQFPGVTEPGWGSGCLNIVTGKIPNPGACLFPTGYRPLSGPTKQKQKLESYPTPRDFPGGASGKESACPCRRLKRHGLIPGSGRFPGGGQGNPPQYSRQEKSQVAKSDTTEATYAHTQSGAITLHCLLPWGSQAPSAQHQKQNCVSSLPWACANRQRNSSGLGASGVVPAKTEVKLPIPGLFCLKQ